jgi:hypothetical protein
MDLISRPSVKLMHLQLTKNMEDILFGAIVVCSQIRDMISIIVTIVCVWCSISDWFGKWCGSPATPAAFDQFNFQ